PPDGDPAAGYDIRFSTDPIETDEDFENAEQFGDPPTPSQPGETDEATVGGLEPDTEYFFAIKSSDFAGNTSDLSNVPSATTEAAPIVGTDPDSLSKTLNTGETGSDVLSILNEGDGTLSFALEPEVGGTEISDPLGDNAPTTSADEDYPMGKYETSAGAPPEDGEPTVEKPKQRVYQPDLGETVYYGVNAATENFVSFQGNNPEVLNQIASYPSGAGFPNAGDFPSDDNSFVWDLDADGNLRQIDVETGEVTEVGTVSGDWCGMATNPNDGTVYVNTCTELFILDPDGPSVESIGSLGIDFMIDIAIDGEGQMYGYGLSNDVLYEIDKETAEITEVGSIGFDANFGQGLTWDTKNQELLMFAFNDAAFQAEFRSVDRATGSTELIGPLGTESPGELSQLGWGATSIDAIPQWLTAEPTEGDVEAGGSQDIDLFYQTTFESEDEDDLIGGLDYFADVVIESNDPSNPTETVPVTLTVEGNPAIGFSDDPLDFGEVFSGTSVTESLSITNESDDAILQVADLQIESEAFTLQESSSFVLDPGESMSLPITFAPDDSDTFEGTLSLSSSAGDQEVGLVGEGVPFVSIAPDSLDQTIDLTTGDSTATQEFTVTNEFSEELPFDVLIETLEGSGNSVDLTPKLTDEQLRRYRQIQERAPRSSEVEPSLEAAPGTGEGTSAIEKVLSESQLDETGVTGYGNDFIGTESIVSFDIGVPGEFTALDDFVPSFAGNFAFANNDEIYWIDNETNELKTYVLEDGSVEVIGELAPEGGSDATWTDIETDPTEGTTYVTTGDGAAETNRLYELDVDDAELSLVGEFADGGLVVAFGIDDGGVGYAHEIGNDEILTVDLETAEAEVLGSTGIDANFAQSMTWDGETGQMLMAATHDCGFFGCDAGTLRQVDRESGETTAIGSFPDGGGNELTWFATPGTGIPWLATNLNSGVLPAGASLTLEAQYDASEQVEGEYNAQISIVGTQLQGEPSEALPVNLTVEAAPIAFLSKDELEFEDTFVNGETAAQLVTLRNDGLANLNLNDVSIDSDNFTVDPDTGQVIEPGDAQIYEVKFTPQEVGEFNPTLSFEGDEISGEVSLSGEGIPAPELAVDPASFEKQAYVGQQTEYFLDVTNAGEDTLDYTAFSTTGDLIDQDFTGDEFPPEGWFRAGANGGENWTTPGNSACSIWVPDNSACFYWSPSTDGTQRLVTKQLDTGGLSKLNVSFTHLVDHFSGDYELRLETTGDGGETWTTVKSWAPGDLPETDEMIELDNEDVGSDEFHVAWTFDGNSFNINTWGVLDVQIGTPDWLAVGPNEGSLTAGETLEHTLSVDATGLEEGTLNAEVVANTNDPLAPTASIPFTLNVIEEVAVQPHPSTPEVFPNQDFAVDFNVESLDDLEVFSYEMEMGFNADRMQVQEVVTDGTLSEDLTLTSNIDNDAGTVTIVAADASGGSEPSQPLFDIEGQGTLVSIEATGQPDHGEMTLDMQNMLFNEGEPPAAAKDSTMSVEELYGDVDLDLSITTMDASEVLDYVVDLTDLGDTQKTHADVSGNGEVSAFDASLILQRTVGSIDCFPVEPDCTLDQPLASNSRASSSGEESDISFSWGEVTRTESTTQASGTGDSDSGTELSVPLTVDQAVWDDSYGELRSIQVSTEIDKDKVSVEDVKGHLPSDWRIVHNVSEDGTLKLSMAGATPLAKVGKISTLTLKRKQSDAMVEVGGSVAVNETSAQTLETKSIVSIPDEFALEGTYPNPFRQSATMKLDLPKDANVTVEVYDLLGRKVKTAHSGKMSAGAGRTVRIDGSDLSSSTPSLFSFSLHEF
ncbi:MAG: peptidase S8, partial [Bacteroidetes bacterium QH_1_61_8]